MRDRLDIADKKLYLEQASYSSAKYACERWHYKGQVPSGYKYIVGVWEHGRFVGVVVFGMSNSKSLQTRFNLERNEVLELVRVALDKHETEVTRIVSIAIRLLKKEYKKLKLLVSFADPAEGHHGGIYQGGNWVYIGTSTPSKLYEYADGKIYHSRSVSTKGYNKQFGVVKKVRKPQDAMRVIQKPPKHRYAYQIRQDKELKERLENMREQPPTCVRSETRDTTTSQVVEGRA
jgi:hypothetical protein